MKMKKKCNMKKVPQRKRMAMGKVNKKKSKK